MKRPAPRATHGLSLTGGHFAAAIVVMGMVTLGTASWLQGLAI